MHKFIFIFFIFILSTTAFAQKVKNVCGEYTFYAPENVSLSEAKRIALERAKLQALADEFGTVISQVNTSVVKDDNGKADSHFFSLSGTEVKGEWIEDKGEPKYTYDTDKENGTLVVTCSICGKAREIISAQIEFMAKVLRNGVEVQNESEIFRSGDDMFLSISYRRFYCRVSDRRNPYCLLSASLQKGWRRTTAGKAWRKIYILFSQTRRQSSRYSRRIYSNLQQRRRA